MGLDMYLSATRYLWSYPEDGPEAQVAKLVMDTMPELSGIKDASVQSIGARVGYWRKANQIHKWFVLNVQDGVDDCSEFEVSREQLVTLRDTCQKVLDDNTLADTLLPAGGGFFFGSTGYDEYYFDNVEHTVQVCNDVLNRFFTHVNGDGEVYSQWDIKYQSSW
jgi:hypothetical protein